MRSIRDWVPNLSILDDNFEVYFHLLDVDVPVGRCFLSKALGYM